jgi:hypothetical protein
MPNSYDNDAQDKGEASAGTRPGDSTKQVRDTEEREMEASKPHDGADNVKTEGLVNRRTYEKWESEGRQDGHHDRHRREAEVEIGAEQSAKPTPVHENAPHPAEKSEQVRSFSTSRSSRRS